jgi:hypothetical protein
MERQVDNNISIFYLTFLLALYYTFVNSHTLWMGMSHLGSLVKYTSLLLSVVLVTSNVTLYESKQKLNILIIALLVVVVAYNAGFAYHGYVFWIYFSLIVGAKEVDFQQIVKFHLSVEFCFCLTNLLADTLGWTDKSLVYMGDQREDMFGEDVIARYSAGYPAATDFATHILYMLLDLWILKKGKLQIVGYAFVLGVVLVIIFYCDARQAAGCIFLVLLASLYLSRLEKKQKALNRLLGRILIMGIPLFFVISLYSTLSYDSSDIGWVAANVVLSGRLALGLDAIEEFGIPWFGQVVKMYGAGFTGVGEEYNYVDCAYVQMLLRWGIIAIILFLLAFVKIGRDAYKRCDYVLLFALFIAGISAMITQFLFYLNYCVFILALTAIHERPNSVGKGSVEEAHEFA